MGKHLFSFVNAKTFCFQRKSHTLYFVVLIFICFSSANTGPLCGNMVVEEGEECDCGYLEECKGKCCYSADSDRKCELRQGSCR